MKSKRHRSPRCDSMKCIGFVSTKEVARIRNAEAFAEVQAGRAIYITKKHYRAVRGRQ